MALLLSATADGFIGAAGFAKAMREMASEHHADLLAHQGPVVAAASLGGIVDATAELGKTARFFQPRFEP